MAPTPMNQSPLLGKKRKPDIFEKFIEMKQLQFEEESKIRKEERELKAKELDLRIEELKAANNRFELLFFELQNKRN